MCWAGSNPTTTVLITKRKSKLKVLGLLILLYERTQGSMHWFALVSLSVRGGVDWFFRLFHTHFCGNRCSSCRTSSLFLASGKENCKKKKEIRRTFFLSPLSNADLIFKLSAHETVFLFLAQEREKMKNGIMKKGDKFDPHPLFRSRGKRKIGGMHNRLIVMHTFNQNGKV